MNILGHLESIPFAIKEVAVHKTNLSNKTAHATSVPHNLDFASDSYPLFTPRLQIYLFSLHFPASHPWHAKLTWCERQPLLQWRDSSPHWDPSFTSFKMGLQQFSEEKCFWLQFPLFHSFCSGRALLLPSGPKKYESPVNYHNPVLMGTQGSSRHAPLLHFAAILWGRLCWVCVTGPKPPSWSLCRMGELKPGFPDPVIMQDSDSLYTILAGLFTVKKRANKHL